MIKSTIAQRRTILVVENAIGRGPLEWHPYALDSLYYFDNERLFTIIVNDDGDMDLVGYLIHGDEDPRFQLREDDDDMD